MLEIQLLGQFYLSADGVRIEIPSRPAQSLLAYLALNAGISYRREKLAGLFWPDVPESKARGSLRHALWSIRSAFEGSAVPWREYLEMDDITVRFLEDSPHQVDARAILEAHPGDGYATEELVEIVSRYESELLPGFYDEWTVLERERLRLSFDHKMRLLLDQLVSERRWNEVIECAGHWIGVGGIPEHGYRALMAAYNGLGDRASMIAAYDRCLEALEFELGIKPSEETRALYAQLLSGEKASLSFTHTTLGEEGDPEGPPAPGNPPYKGLNFFGEEDADFFFGREDLTARLVGILREASSLVVVVGASGSGKSSLLRAGLLPTLKRRVPLAGDAPLPDDSASWLVRILTPTAQPLEAIATLLKPELDRRGDQLASEMSADKGALKRAVEQLETEQQAPRLLLIVDQFEETFSLCRDECQREMFIQNLLKAAGPEGRTSVVIALRADFYAHCAKYPHLREALEEYQVYVGPMSAQELRLAIERPAELGGWRFQSGLVDLLLRDVRSEPGALPLLSHALLETWQRRSGRLMTLQGYAGAGSVRGAIARSAEQVYNHSLTPEQQVVAKNIFLRLTELGEETQDTRRRVELGELTSSEGQTGLVEEVLNRLAQARLVTIQEEVVEVAHEALIREWPTLRGWLDEDRDGLRLHRRLTEASQGWQEMGRDSEELYRGARLLQALEWAREHEHQLNELERQFLQASQLEEADKRTEEEARRQRELEAARKLAEAEKRRAEDQSRANRRLRWLAIGLSIAMLLALGIGGVAYLQRERAVSESLIAKSRELAAAAIANLEVDPELSILLALEAVKQAENGDLPVPKEAEEALHRSVQASHLKAVLKLPGVPIFSVAFSPDGRLLAAADANGNLHLWETEGYEKVASFRAHSQGITSISFSPDGKRLASGSNDFTARILDSSSGKELLVLPAHKGWVWETAFNPDGTRLATGGDDSMVRVWDASSGKVLLTLQGHTQTVMGIAYNPDGSRLASASHDGTLRVWDGETGEQLIVISVKPEGANKVSFSPDGDSLVASDTSGLVRVWDAITGEERFTYFGHTSWVNQVSFSKDGSQVATGGKDRKVQIWDPNKGETTLILGGHTGEVLSLAFSPDGSTLASSSFDGEIRLWDLSPGKEQLTIPTPGASPPIALSPDGSLVARISEEGQLLNVWDTKTGIAQPEFKGKVGNIGVVTFSPDGAVLSTADLDGTVRIWDSRTGTLLQSFSGNENFIDALAFSPDGDFLASTEEWTVRILEVETGREVMSLQGNASLMTAVEFHGDGTMVAANSEIGLVKIWELKTGEETNSLSGHEGTVNDLSFSPDGQQLVTAGGDGQVIVWDLESGEKLLDLKGHNASVEAVTYLPDGTRLATASLDGTIRIWDADSGQELILLSTGGHEGFGSLAISQDGSLLAGGAQTSIQLFLTELDDLVELATLRLTRQMTIGECQKYLGREMCTAPSLQAPVASNKETISPREKICLVSSRHGLLGRYIYNGFQKAIENLGWESGIAEAYTLTNYPVAIQNALDSGCDPIVTVFTDASTAAEPFARDHPERRFMFLDAASQEPMDNVWGQLYRTDQNAFLAGYVSAAVSQTGVVATFGGIHIPPVADFMIGFEQGVMYYNRRNDAEVQVLGWNSAEGEGAFINNFCCEEEGWQMTRQMLAEGADVIFPVAGPYVGAGSAKAIQENGDSYFVGVDFDWKIERPEYADVVLTSVVKLFDVSVYHFTQAIANGTFVGGTHFGTLETGEVGLSPFYELDALIPDEIKTELEQIIADIISGKIKTRP